jgi:two-component system, OmpR family, response regulator TctD
MNPTSPSHCSGENRPIRILLVEDDPEIRRLGVRILLRMGHSVDTAFDGEKAWEALNRVNYRLLVTDNAMPRLSGLDLMAKIRAAALLIPVIMISGSVPEESFRLRPWLRPDFVLQKPFEVPALMQTVEAALLLGARPRPVGIQPT